MQILSAKEFLVGIALIIIAFFSGRYTKQCAVFDISEIENKNKKLEEKLIDAKSDIDLQLLKYYNQNIRVNDLKKNIFDLEKEINAKPRVITRIKEKLVYVKPDECVGVIGTDRSNEFNKSTNNLKKGFIDD